jgi:hypothetical protein
MLNIPNLFNVILALVVPSNEFVVDDDDEDDDDAVAVFFPELLTFIVKIIIKVIRIIKINKIAHLFLFQNSKRLLNSEVLILVLILLPDSRIHYFYNFLIVTSFQNLFLIFKIIDCLYLPKMNLFFRYIFYLKLFIFQKFLLKFDVLFYNEIIIFTVR